MHFLANIGIGGARAGIDPGHAAIADGREQHRDHGDEDGCDDVALGLVADDAVNPHGRRWLNNNHADDDEIPEAKSPIKAYAGRCTGLGWDNGLAPRLSQDGLPLCRSY